MKTIEEKAKAYDEALERAKKQRADYQKELDKTDKNSQLAGLLRAGISAIDMAFPELRKSEDERVGNVLYCIVRDNKEVKRILEGNGISVDATLAYLEKQKYDRMKPIYDARESFESALEKAWNDYHNGYENVDRLEDDYVECAHAKGFREGYLFGLKKHKEPNLEDIKDETVRRYMKLDKFALANMLAERDKTNAEVIESIESIEKQPVKWSDTDMKEARSNLISVCIDWERGEQTTLLPIAAVRARYFLEHLTEPKPTKQDSEEMFDKIDDSFRRGREVGFREGVESVKPTKWSEEDEIQYERVLYYIQEYQEKCKDKNELQKSISGYSWLKSLPERVSLQSKQECIEEADKKIVELKTFIALCNGFNKENRKKAFDMIDALRPSWKPSEEQMKAFEESLMSVAYTENKTILESLYEQLKKLM